MKRTSSLTFVPGGRVLFAAAIAVASILSLVDGASAQRGFGIERGPSGLPLPRFVSLKSSKVNVRVGPGRDHKLKWTFRKAGLPVEVVREFDNWRRIRDAEGDEGWVFHALLSSERTALVRPWVEGETLPLHARPDQRAPIVAKLEPKVVARVSGCDTGWCRVAGAGWEGYVRKTDLWGVYPDEVFD